MTTPTYNPGEPIFDPSTGDLVINPATGDAEIVAPSKKYTDPASNRVFDGDDVGGAVFYRLNTYTGEIKTDQSRGVDYPNFVFGNVGLDVALAELVAEGIQPTPGVQAVSNVDITEFDAANRVLFASFTILKQNGERIRGAANVVG